MRIPFIGPAYTTRSINAASQRCVNLYPELYEVGPGKEREVAYLSPTPGLELVPSIGPDKVRGIYISSTGKAFVAKGNRLYYYDDITMLFGPVPGTIANFSGRVSMADNGIDLVLVDGTNGYSVNLTTLATIVQITDPNFYGADFVVFLDGYFVFNRPGTKQFYISGLYALTFGPLDFASVEGSPDNITAMVVSRRELWFVGAFSVEIFTNTGNADFPFERIEGGVLSYGCLAPLSLVEADASVFFLSKDTHGSFIVMQTTGYQPTRISTNAIEAEIGDFTAPEDCTAFVHQLDGHIFYVMNFTTDNRTFVYDSLTKLWHERAYLYPVTGELERHRAEVAAAFKGDLIAGDYSNGNLYIMTPNVHTDFGDVIPRIRACQHISQDMLPIKYNQIILDVETGVGLDGSPVAGTDPIVMMRFSDDGGHKWSNQKIARLGKIGKTKRRAIWRGMGASIDRVIEISIGEPVKVTMMGMTIRAGLGNS